MTTLVKMTGPCHGGCGTILRFKSGGLGLCARCLLDGDKVAVAKHNRAMFKQGMDDMLAKYGRPDPLGRPGIVRIDPSFFSDRKPAKKKVTR